MGLRLNRWLLGGGAFFVMSAMQAGEPNTLPKTIRVGLANHESEVHVNSNVPLIVPGTPLKPQQPLTFEWRSGYMVCQGRLLPNDVIVEPEKPGSLLSFKGNTYRGLLHIRSRKPDKLQVINEVRIEDYLLGVLPQEVSPAWAPETLKAQAVVSRSFAANSLNRHQADGYDMCSLTHCQVYRGTAAEDPRTTKAVRETEGVVLTYQGNLITAYFHDDCGGRTESASDVWKGSTLPYLTSVRCRSRDDSTWTITLSPESLAHALKKPEVNVSEIRGLTVASRTQSGRARNITILTRHYGNIVFSANTLRLRLGADKVKSTLWKKIRKTPQGWEISGVGWGHGVGFCQRGAEWLGERGKDYETILRQFYKGIRIEHWAQH